MESFINDNNTPSNTSPQQAFPSQEQLRDGLDSPRQEEISRWKVFQQQHDAAQQRIRELEQQLAQTAIHRQDVDRTCKMTSMVVQRPSAPLTRTIQTSSKFACSAEGKLPDGSSLKVVGNNPEECRELVGIFEDLFGK